MGGVCDSEGGDAGLIECVGGVFIGSAVWGVVGGGVMRDDDYMLCAGGSFAGSLLVSVGCLVLLVWRGRGVWREIVF